MLTISIAEVIDDPVSCCNRRSGVLGKEILSRVITVRNDYAKKDPGHSIKV